MYHIQNKEEVKKLVSKTLSVEHKLKSSVFDDDMDEKENIYEVFPIIENIEIENIQKMADELDNGDGVIIIYTNTDNLEMEFEKIISIYNIIQLVK